MSNQIIKVQPISEKSKKRFSSLMDNDPYVDIVEGDKDDDRILCASGNKKYYFWLTKSNSTDWTVLREKK
tara:strand:+ start:2726 stop:2935 length:210 start_codon:yes stop_codon:yes gene_type:complete